MRISDWSSDVCSSDLPSGDAVHGACRLRLRFRRAHHARREFRLAAALHPHERRLLLLHRRLHPHLPRPLLRLLQGAARAAVDAGRSEEHTSELQSLMRISYAVFCLQKKKTHKTIKKEHEFYNSHKNNNSHTI